MKQIVYGILMLLPVFCWAAEPEPRTVRDMVGPAGRRPPVVDGRFNIAHGRLTGLDGLQDVPDIGGTRVLDASHNRLAQLEPGSLDGIPALEYIDLSGNALEAVGDDVFGARAPRPERPIYVDITGNRLRAYHQEKLHDQVEAINRPRRGHFAIKIGEKVFRWLRIGGNLLVAPAYVALKLHMNGNPKYDRANVVLRTGLHGVRLAKNLYNYSKQLILRRQLPSVAEAMDMAHDAVNINDIINPGNTVSNIITKAIGLNCNFLKCNPFYWGIALPVTAAVALKVPELRKFWSLPLLPVCVSPVRLLSSLVRLDAVWNPLNAMRNRCMRYIENRFRYRKYSLAHMQGADQQVRGENFDRVQVADDVERLLNGCADIAVPFAPIDQELRDVILDFAHERVGNLAQRLEVGQEE